MGQAVLATHLAARSVPSGLAHNVGHDDDATHAAAHPDGDRVL